MFNNQYQNSLKFLKITYNDGKRTLNAYIKLPSPTYELLKHDISKCLFEQRKVPQCNLRTYWIDEEKDHIDIVNQCDYDVFISERSEKPHIYVAPVEEEKELSKEDQQKNVPDSEDDPAAFVIHERVECDACGLAPIVGFRYKCIQCPNFDLCQCCEAQHKHPEHMMLRMPTENSPNVIDAWISSPCGGGRGGSRRSKRKSTTATGCPFYEFAATASSANVTSDGEGNNATGSSGKHHHHHERKHQRRQMRNGFLSHMYEMMSDFAEGDATYRKMDDNDPTTPRKTAPTDAGTANTQKSANAAAKAACEAATIAAEAATKFATEVATKVTEQAAAVAVEVAAQGAAAATQAAEQASKTATPSAQQEGAAAAAEENEGAQAPKTTTSTGTSTPLNNSNVNTSIPTTPSLEDLVQFVDPKFMKAGIQLLNNFSGMFAKMLDPMEGADESYASSFAGSGYHARKGSTASAASSTNSAATPKSTTSQDDKPTTNDNLTKQNEQNVNTQTENKQSIDAATSVEIVTATNISTSATNTTPIVVETDVEKEQTPERQRTQSEDSDWQLVDRQPAESTINLADVSASSSTESMEKLETPGAEAVETPATPASTPVVETITPENIADISFEKLNEDLKNHIAREKIVQNIERKFKIADILNLPKPQPKESPRASTGATPKINQSTDVVYHKDASINKAIHAMMAMGFSNESGWLTQLLESVNGNISAALDLMSPAQNQSNN